MTDTTRWHLSRATMVACALAAVLFASPAVAQQEADDQAKPQPAAKPAAQADAYPLLACPVSGEKFKDGEPGALDKYQGRLIGYCCPGCPKALKKEPEKFLPKIDNMIAEQQGKDYALGVCPISGQPIPKEGFGELVHNNRLIRFCCNNCPKAFMKDPDKGWAKLNAAVIERQKADYPSQVCVVSGEELGAMGDAIHYVHANRLVRFCCKGCVKKFRKAPNKYMAKLDAAAKGDAKADTAQP